MSTSRLVFVFILTAMFVSCDKKQDARPDGKLRESLLQQLKNSDSEEAWFAPMHKAITGVTAQQASWKDSSENHSIGQLTSHLVFWNARALQSFQGNKPPDFQGSNDTTFKQLGEAEWSAMQTQLDSIQQQIEQVVSGATDEQLTEWTVNLNNLCMHNAYHTGQIVYIRKRNGWWKPQ